MGASALTVPRLSPLPPIAVPPRGFTRIDPYDQAADPLRDLSPVLAERRRRLTEAAGKAAEGSARASRAAADLLRRAGKLRLSWARAHGGARVELLGASVRAAAMARGVYTARPQLMVVSPGGFGSWDRFIVRAVCREVDARRAVGRSGDKTMRADGLGRKAKATAKSQAKVAAISQGAAEIEINVRYMAAVREAQRVGGGSEDKRMADMKDKLAERLKVVREHPVDAETGARVTLKASNNQKAAKARLLQTASKFKGGGRVRAPAPMPEEPALEVVEFGQVLIAPARVQSIRTQVELERNRRSVPTRWDSLFVDLWLIGAYETLFRMPMKIRPQSYGSAMPTPTNHAEVEWGDELARLTLEDDDEAPPLFGMARLRTLGLPDKIEVDRMHTAIHWPSEFLQHDADLARFVGLGAMWKAVDLSHEMIKERVKDHLDMWYADFDRKRGLGLELIAEGLNAANARRATG